MLLGYGAKNCWCFKDWIDINLRLNGYVPKDVSDNKNYSLILGFEGANASGKTSALKVFAFRNKNDAQIMQSASGGVGALAAQEIIKEGGIAYGVSYDKSFGVKHIRVDCLSDLPQIQSSKYVQSDTGDTYSQVQKDLQSGKMVLYTGTPCQIAGLYSFLGKE